MNDRRLSDAQIAIALRAHLPTAAQAGLRERAMEAVEITSQQRPLPSFLGALSDADPAVRRRSLLIAAAFLLALAFASATAVGAWRLLERETLPKLDVLPSWPRNILDVLLLPLEPGTYYIEPKKIPLRVLYTVPADGWQGWIGAGKPDQRQNRGYRHVAVSIVNVTNVVVDGCTDHGAPNPPIGPTVDDLATALAALPPFLVTKPPRDVDIYGYHGKYLQIAVPDMPLEVVGDESYFPDCSERELNSWIGEPLYAFWGYTEPGQQEEFWILDVEGRRLVIEANWSPGSPKEDIAEMRAILDSIKIEP
jgi:hypothetical protein